MNRILYSVVSCGSLFSDSAYKTERIIYLYMWKDVVGYEWLYQVSDCNEWVMSLSYNNTYKRKLLKWWNHKDWYIIYNLSKKWVSSPKNLHRLVAKAFIPNPDNYPVVMHLDNDPSNNNVTNLKWWTVQENNKQRDREWRGYFQNSDPRTNLWKFWFYHPSSMKVWQYSKEWILLNEYYWIAEASRKTWIHNTCIGNCCAGRQKTSWWYIWKFL